MTIPRMNSQISSFGDKCWEDMGTTLLMLHRAIGLLPATWLQSPHWREKPAEEQVQQEREYERQMEEAVEEIEKLAGAIYLALTGNKVKVVIRTQPPYGLKEVS